MKLSTPSPLRGTTPVSGVETGTTENTAPANYPPETGGTRREATEGVDSYRLRHRLLCPPGTGRTRSEATEGVDGYRYRHRLLCPPGTVIPGGAQ